MIISKEQFSEEIKKRAKLVDEIFIRPEYTEAFQPIILRDAVLSYLKRPAKRFRPCLLMLSCAAVGGREEDALLAAAAAEVYHTWTLVHDDIIDNDIKRRGYPTVHEEIRLKALEMGYSEQKAVELGRNVAILAGDLQHGWAVRLLCDLSKQANIPAQVTLDIINRMENELTNGLVEGEALDVLYSERNIDELTEAEILNMLELKTGVLYEFVAMAGASIGLRQTPPENALIGKIGHFARRCGAAFQLQDDILGIIGDEKKIGKAVNSDIREGKRTIIVLHAYAHANDQEKAYLLQYLGNPDANAAEIEAVKALLLKYHSVEYVRELAEKIVDEAIKELNDLPESPSKDILLTWAEIVIDREV